MNHRIYLKSALLLSSLAFGGWANAATIYTGDPDDADSPYSGETLLDGAGITYSWTVIMGSGESISTPSSPDANVGAWSWEDTTFAGGPGKGWTHTASWVALELTEATTLVLTVTRNPGIPMPGGFRPVDNLYPSFTIWTGWDNSGEDGHTFNNKSTNDWAEQLTSVAGYVENTTDHTATAVYELGAGLYTIALGSKAAAVAGLPRQGFTATFSTIPEPASVSLAAMAIAGAALRRRRY